MPQVVLVEPQIPPNTGNVARTCAACGIELHLVGPLGFSLDDRQLRRAGLDYWPLVPLHQHGHWQHFLKHHRRRGGRLLAFSSHANTPFHRAQFRADDWLLFGCESDGLSDEVLRQADARLTIPMPGNILGSDHDGVRSLNLSVSVAVGLYESLRQLKQLDATDPVASKV